MVCRFASRSLLTPVLSVCAALVFLQSGCTKSDDDDEEETASENGAGSPFSPAAGSPESANILATAFPNDLALAAFPRGGTALQGNEDEQTVSEKVAANDAKLRGDAAECISAGLFGGNNPPPAATTCYNFDSDMNPFENGGQSWGTTDGTDGNGEACMVAFARGEVQDAVNTVDRALELVAGLMCQAQKDGASSSLPAVGASIDLASSLATAAGDGATVSSATISRLDDSNGVAVYRTDIAISDSASEGTMEVHLVHAPESSDLYTGTLWFITTGDQQGGEGDPNNTANKNNIMSINYQRLLDGDNHRVRFEVQRAQIVNTIDPVNDAGMINFAGVAEDAQNDTIHAIRYIAFDVNPETNEGDLSYWQNPGGNYNESARGFLFNVSSNTDGRLAGCGVSGAANSVSIRKALAEEGEELAPTGYYHPMYDQNTSSDADSRYDSQQANFVTKQCFVQSDTGSYVIDTGETTHASGYDVIATAEGGVEPPKTPDANLGDGITP